MATIRLKMAMRIGIVLAVGVAVLVGGYGFHKYRKRAIVRQALASGTAAYEAKEWSQAADNLGRYLAARPRDVDVLIKYAGAQMHRRPQTKSSLQQVTAALETALRVQPGNPKASKTLAEFYLALNAPIEAERVARGWSTAHPDDVDARESLATALVSQQKLDEVAQLLEPLVAAHPERAGAASTLAFLRVVQAKQDPQEAVKLLDAAVTACKESAASRIVRARFLLTTGQFLKARQDIEAAENQPDNDQDTLLNLAGLLAQAGFYDRANVQFDRAEKLAPDNVDAYLLRSTYLVEAKDYPAGLALADRALAAPLGEKRPDMLPVAAELYAMGGRPADARTCIEQLKGIETSSEMLLYLEGLASIAEGKSNEGITSFQEAVRRAPRFGQAHLALGRAYANNGDMKRASSALEEAVKLSDRSILARIELANIYATMQRWDEAAKVAQEAQQQAPLNGQAIMTNLEMQAMMARPGSSQADTVAIGNLYEQVKPLAAQAKDDLRLQMLLARLAAWKGHLDEASTILKPFHANPNTRVAAGVMLVDLYVQANQYDHAIETCKGLLAVADPLQLSTLQSRLIELYNASGNEEAAAEAIATLVAQPASPARSAAMVALAESLIQSQNQEKARELLATVVADDQTNLAARLMLLAVGPGKGTAPNAQQLVDQVKKIEGDGGVNWRIWQVRLWMSQEQTPAVNQKIETLLAACLTRSPDSEEAATLLAAHYQRRGDPAKARTLYEQALTADPTNARLAARVLDLTAQSQQWDKVDQILSRFSADTPELLSHFVTQAMRKGDVRRGEDLLSSQMKSGTADYRANLQMATLKQLQGDFPAARKQLVEAATLAPDSTDVLTAQVSFHRSQAQADQAIRLCNASLARKVTPEALTLRAAMYEFTDRLPEAQKDLEQAATIDGWAEQGCMNLGMMYARNDRVDLAMKTWRDGMKQTPGSLPLRQVLTRALLAGDTTQQQEGATMLKALLKEKQNDEALLMIKAQMLETTNLAQAEAQYELIIRDHPGAAGAYQRLALMAMNRGQRDRAIAMVNKGLEASPQTMDLLIAKAELLAADNPGLASVAAKQAETIARQTLLTQPYNEQAVVTLAHTLAMTGNTAGAIRELTSFLIRKEGAKALEARLVLARLYLSSKDMNAADRLIGEALSIASDDPRPVQARISWYAAVDQWDKVYPLAEAFSAKHPEDVAVKLSAARLMGSSSQPVHQEEAIKLLASTSKTGPAGAYVWGELALAHYRSGKIAEARDAFEKALEAEPGHAGLTNNLAWIICEDQKDPAGAQKLIAECLKVDAGTSDYASLLDTSGVVEYRLALVAPSAGHMQQSQKALEACLGHPGATDATKASAAFHLGRTLSDVDTNKSRQILEAVLNDPAQKALLSVSDQEEAAQLLQRLQKGP